MKILHVDDDSSILEQSRLFLERKDTELSVDTAQSAEEGIKMLDSNSYDAVVSDYKMPGMNGLDFLRDLRVSEGNDIPFIIFTGRGREEVAMEALNLGADRYLQKRGNPKSQYHLLYQALEQEVEHWRTKSRLQSTEKKYKDLAEKSVVGIYVIQDGVFRYVNPEFCKIFGYSRDELIGKQYIELVDEEDKELVKNGVEEREKGEGEAKKYSFRAVTKTGEKIHVRVFSVPSSYQGNPSVQGTLIDVTEKKKIKNELEEKNRRLSALLDNLPGTAYICLMDEKWTMKYISEGCLGLTGYKPEELVDNKEISYVELIKPDDRDYVRRNVEEAVDRGEHFKIDYYINTKAGEEKRIWERGKAVEYEGEKLLKGIVLDFEKIEKLD